MRQDVREAGAICLLHGEEEWAAGEGGVGLRDGLAEKIRSRDAPNDMAIGVVDGDGGLRRRERDGAG